MATSTKTTMLRTHILSMVSQPIKDHLEETTTDQTMIPIILTPMDTTTEENHTIKNPKKRVSDLSENNKSPKRL